MPPPCDQVLLAKIEAGITVRLVHLVLLLGFGVGPLP